jgi:hypothetical protein
VTVIETNSTRAEALRVRSAIEHEALEDLRRLYAQWATGGLPSEDFIFLLGDVIEDVGGELA